MNQKIRVALFETNCIRYSFSTFSYTAGWIAPEVGHDKEHSYESDIYSLGLILYGITIKSKNPFNYLNFLLESEMDKFQGDLIFFSDILCKCLNVNPKERYSIEELNSNFRSVMESHSTSISESFHTNSSSLEVKCLMDYDHNEIAQEYPKHLLHTLVTALTVQTKFVRINSKIEDKDDWVVTVIKKISQNRAVWKIEFWMKSVVFLFIQQGDHNFWNSSATRTTN